MISTTFKSTYGESFSRNEDLIKRYRTHLSKIESHKGNLSVVRDFPDGYEWLNTKND